MPLHGVRPMEDASHLWRAGDLRALRRRLARDGYLLLRGALDRHAVLRARADTLQQLALAVPSAFAPGTALEDGFAAPGASALGLLGRQHIAARPLVSAVLECDTLFELAAALLGVAADEVITPAYKWTRAVAPGEFTGVHCDSKFVGGTPERTLTAWLPLGDVPLPMGGLLVAAASHRLRSFAAVRERYLSAPLGADGTASGWLCRDAADVAAHLPRGAAPPDWRAADVGAGDVVILRMDCLHMTARNVSDRIRTSCDTRWQPAGEARDGRITHWRDRCGRRV